MTSEIRVDIFIIATIFITQGAAGRGGAAEEDEGGGRADAQAGGGGAEEQRGGAPTARQGNTNSQRHVRRLLL